MINILRRLLVVCFLAITLCACSATSLLNVAAMGGKESRVKDISYGDNQRQKYDLYLPENITDNTPVMLFIYGGTWQMGSRNLYPFLGDSFASSGIITAIADYRLYPEVKFPDFVYDGAKAFAALKKRYPDRPVFIMGHSAGAHIAALLSLDPRYLNAVNLNNCRDVAGLIGISGPYDFLPLTRPALKEVFPASMRAQSQPINFANSKKPASLLIHGLADETVEADNSIDLAAALRSAGNRSETKLYKNAGHINIIAATSRVLTAQAPTREDVIAFILQERSNGYPRCE
ncbi:hypothetical protein SU32_04100 [Ahrensia marina]|uniref:BD-FAE-like domain-containing protein n=2 Tax=Ahrensia marina TaxID=1514904 RepID=A0A0N0E8C7_9HYPH|nr:hypothetical protein SU32_04100 [Ahrensia marina]